MSGKLSRRDFLNLGAGGLAIAAGVRYERAVGGHREKLEKMELKV